MLDEDDLMIEQRGWGHGSGPSRHRPLGGGKGKEEMYENDDDEPAPRSLSSFRAPEPKTKQKSKLALLVEDDDDDDNDAPVSRRRPRAQEDYGTAMVSAKGARPVPWRVQEGAALVLEYREANLSARARDELTLHFLQHPHEFYTKDPPVVLWACADTGSVRIYCKDVVPVSLHLLALAFGATFQLQVTPKVRTAEQPWAEAIQVRACRSDRGVQAERCQPLNTAASVAAALEHAELDLRLVESRTARYMEDLGPLDTRDVCDPDWLEQHTKGLRNACMAPPGDMDGEGAGIKAKLARMAKGGE